MIYSNTIDESIKINGNYSFIIHQLILIYLKDMNEYK